MSVTRQDLRNVQRTSSSAELVKLWSPTDESIARTNISAALQRHAFVSFEELYRCSIEQPERFWADVLARLGVKFHRQPSTILAADSTPSRDDIWLPGSLLNIAESCFQAAPGDTAILAGDEEGIFTTVTYAELEQTARRVASGLQRLNFRQGDAVALFMPMNARAVAIYLGAILAGCVVVSIADSMSPEQVSLRLRIGNAKAAFTQTAVKRGGRVIPLFERLGNLDIPTVLADDGPGEKSSEKVKRWSDFLGDEDDVNIAHGPSSTPINIIFSSGTTGDPKAIPWDQTTPIKAASDGHFHHDIHDSDVVAWPTNFGWMMGPWLTFATLINRGTIALFEGAPTGRVFGEFVERAKVSILGVVPSLVARWQDTNCMEGLDWSSIRLLSSTGECSSPTAMQFLSKLAGGKPIIEYCGGTELGGGYISSTTVHDNFASAFSTPTLGTQFVVVDDQQHPAHVGEVFLVHPAMGMSQRLVNADHHAAYYDATPPGPEGQITRRHGDQLERLANGYFRVQGRADDAINLGGIKVGSAELERAVGELALGGEIAMIGVASPDGGPNQLIACIGATAEQVPDSGQLKARMQQLISEKLCPLFRISDLFFCGPFPRTASNKVMRRELRRLYENQRHDGQT